MKKISLFLILSALIISSAYSQDESMKKWMDYMTPGDVHKQMEKCSGKWNVKTKMWMDPAAEPTVTEGTATGESLLGGRYLMMKHSSTMMGMPFEGISIDGYDNATKEYNSIWMDNMGTGIMYMTGKWNESTKSVEYKGKMVDPMTGGLEDIRSIVKTLDDGSMYMEMWGSKDGKDIKWMESTMTR